MSVHAKLKLISSIIITSLIMLTIIACPTGGATGTYSTSNVPGNIKVQVPKSLRGQGVAGGALQGATREVTGTSYSYFEIQWAIEEMEFNSRAYTPYVLQMDAAISENELTTGSTVHTGLTVTYTREMVNAMYDMDPYLQEIAADDPYSDEWLPSAGEIEFLPDFYYGDVSNDGSLLSDVTIDTAGYHLFIKVDWGTLWGGGVTDIFVMLWDNDRTKSKIVQIFDEPGFYNYNMVYTYDYNNGSPRSTLLYVDKFDGNDYLYSVTMEEKNQKKHGVMISFINDYSDEFYESSYKAKGYADDDGGYLESEWSMKEKTGNMRETFKFKEQFKGNGTLTGAKYYENTTGQWLNDGTWAETEYDDLYDTYDDTWENEDPDLFDDYMATDEALIYINPTITLPDGLTEHFHDYVLTESGTPDSDWGNVLGFFTVFPEDPATFEYEVTVVNVSGEPESSYQLHQVTSYDGSYNVTGFLTVGAITDGDGDYLYE
jgi:hypothetical protein